jgi:rhomboid protease GluP
MLSNPVPVYRSPRLGDCEERAFVLTAVGIPSTVMLAGDEFVLAVNESAANEAREHLARYAIESRPPPPPPPPPRLHPFAWVGCLAYVVIIMAVTLAISNGVGRLDSFELGAIDSARVKAGEWWRAWTALTLHLDAAHLLANLGAGVWFGYLAGRQMGPGLAWFLAVTGAALANLLECLLGPPTHLAVGASTAVFTMLGLLSAHTWRDRLHLKQRWALRWGPLVAGVVLLGFTGSGASDALEPEGSKTDVVAHVAGFIVGTALGALVALPAVARRLRAIPQWVTGGAAAASIAAAWIAAQLS